VWWWLRDFGDHDDCNVNVCVRVCEGMGGIRDKELITDKVIFSSGNHSHFGFLSFAQFLYAHK